MKRKPLTRAQRVRIFDNHKGICVLCDLPIRISSAEVWIVEHLKPLWLGGLDEPSNMGPAHLNCAIDKTRGEAPVKAKTDRQRAKHLGVKKPRSIRSWRRFDGTPVHAGRER